MNWLYDTGIFLYSGAAKVASLRRRKAAKMVKGQRQTFALLDEKIKQGERYVWVHAASLGEFEQGRTFIEMIKREIPGVKVILTFFSPSGYEVRKNYPGADLVCYLPFDTPRNARRFVSKVNPVAAVFVKYEFWRNYLNALRKSGVPTFLISSIFRPGQSFFRWWGGIFRDMLGCYNQIFVQDSRSEQLLAEIGVRHVTVAGDTRFDRVTDIMRTAHDIAGFDEFVVDASLTLVVGSSWEADEAMYIPWLKKHPDVKSIVAPHEFDDVRIDKLRRQLGDGTILITELEKDLSLAKSARHIIVNCFGVLSSLYRYGDIAYIGGGFGAGIHNVNEAAVYDIPVVFGPNNKKFKEAHDLLECGGGIAVCDAHSTAVTLDMLLNDDERRRRGKSAGDYIKSQLGATARVFSMVRRVLK